IASPEEAMRTNLPVTQREHLLGDNDVLLSTTDIKGRLTYTNDPFLRVSGFEREKLYGKAHNVVRNPDMPEAAFADMWRTIQSGCPWTALVKNRRKDGDHYWVRANAAPLRQGDEVVGYLSVRTKPTDDSVRIHAALYERLREGSAGLKLFRGLVFHAGPRGLWSRWRRGVLRPSARGRGCMRTWRGRCCASWNRHAPWPAGRRRCHCFPSAPTPSVR